MIMLFGLLFSHVNLILWAKLVSFPCEDLAHRVLERSSINVETPFKEPLHHKSMIISVGLAITLKHVFWEH